VSENIRIRVIDAYSVKPIDAETLLMAAQEAGNKIVTVEDHWPEGGLGDAVLEVFTQRDGALPQVVKLQCSRCPARHSCRMIEEAGISAHHIAQAVKALYDH